MNTEHKKMLLIQAFGIFFLSACRRNAVSLHIGTFTGIIVEEHLQAAEKNKINHVHF